MSEINRILAYVDGYFGSRDTDQSEDLAKVLEVHLEQTRIGFAERGMEDEALLERMKATSDRMKVLTEAPLSTLKEQQEAFRELTIEVMTARRAILPLKHPRIPWKKTDPRKALFDDDDQFSYAVYDTLVEEVAGLLPDLQRIAVEVDWDD